MRLKPEETELQAVIGTREAQEEYPQPTGN
jgi:hypothetical protein